MKTKSILLAIILISLIPITLQSQVCNFYVNKEYGPTLNNNGHIWNISAFNSIINLLNSKSYITSDCIDKTIYTLGSNPLVLPKEINGQMIHYYGLDVGSPLSFYNGAEYSVDKLTVNYQMNITSQAKFNVHNSIDFVSGLINLHNASITLTKGATSNSFEDSYINTISPGTGFVYVTTNSRVSVPIGTDLGYSPVIIDTDPGETFGVRSDNEPIYPDSTLKVSWQINRIIGAANIASLKFIYPKAVVPSNFDPSTCKILFRDNNNQEKTIDAHTELYNSNLYITTASNIIELGTFTIVKQDMVSPDGIYSLFSDINTALDNINNIIMIFFVPAIFIIVILILIKINKISKRNKS